jgi:hypothetical protein
MEQLAAAVTITTLTPGTGKKKHKHIDIPRLIWALAQTSRRCQGET